MILYALMLTVIGSLNYFDGNIVLVPPGDSVRVAISQDGQRVYVSLNNVYNQTLVYENTGTSFVETQIIPSHELIYALSVSSSSRHLLIQHPSYYAIWETVNLTLEQQTNETFPLAVICGGIFSPDGTMIFFISASTIKIYQKGQKEYEFFQQIEDSSNNLIQISISQKGQIFAVGESSSGKMWIYEKERNYGLIQIIQVPSPIVFMKITEERELILIYGSTLSWWKEFGQGFIEEGNMDIMVPIIASTITDDLQLIYITSWSTILVLERNYPKYDVRYQQPISSMCWQAYLTNDRLYLLTLAIDGTVTVRFKSPQSCISCHMPNNCITCVDGFVLVDGVCHPKPTNCVRNVMVTDGICQEYCASECKTCNNTRGDCYECSHLYRRNKAGQCVIGSAALDFAARARFFLNLVRRGGFKFAFFVVDDLWLYSYHQKKYDGVVRQVLDVIQLVEEKQWELVGLAELKQSLEDSMQEGQPYNAYSNERHMEEARNNDVFVGNTVDFFVFGLPALLLFVFLCNRLFYLLFNYRVSFLLRPYSFWAVLLELALQSNIEYFTFLGLRSLGIPFSFSCPSKWLLILAVTMFFLVVFTAFISYALYYCWYGKLARYFLVNMYRFPSSYALMIFLYGIRPFMKGLAHALFHSHFVLQLQILAAIEVAMILLTLAFEVCIGNHKSRKVLVLELLYMVCLVLLNILLLLKHHYFAGESDKIESYLKLLVYCMILLLVLRLFFELVVENISKDCLKSVFCFCRETSQVTPMSEAASDKKADSQEQKKQSPKQKKQSAEVVIDQANNFLLQLYRKKLAPTFTFRKSQNRRHQQ